MKQFFKILKHHNQRYKVFLFLYLALAIIAAVAELAQIRLTGEMSQAAAIDQDTAMLLQFLVIVSGIVFIRAIVSAISVLYIRRYRGHVGYRFRDNFAKHFLRKPFSALEQSNTGESLSVYSNDLPMATDLIINGGIQMIVDFTTLIITFVYMLTLTIPYTLILFASFPLLAGMQVLIAMPIQKRQQRRLKAQADFTAIVNDSLQNTSTIAAYSLEDVMHKRCAIAQKTVINTLRQYILAFAPLVIAGMMASFAPLIIVVAVSSRSVINGSMSLAQYVAFISLASQAGSWLGGLSQRLNSLQTGAAGAKRLLDTVGGKEESLEGGGPLHNGTEAAVDFKNITFSYELRKGEADATEETAEKPPTLDSINFRISKGERVALVGGSGSGKSTVLKLLLGLYTAQNGQISVLGTDINNISLETLRNSFAYVPQDSFLFPESIGANITGETEITDMPKLEKACSDAGILEFIKNLPDQFNSVLNESAENISGGQKQRIALARAFYRNAPIILFDEATSALDPSTEAAVLKSFDCLASDKTIIMVAHRLKAIDFCDTIILMDSGKIAAIGTHSELLTNSPIYKNLYEMQNKEAA